MTVCKTGGKRSFLQGQRGITDEDIAKIPDIISNYDDVKFPGKSKLGKDLLKDIKKMADGTVFYVE